MDGVPEYHSLFQFRTQVADPVRKVVPDRGKNNRHGKHPGMQQRKHPAADISRHGSADLTGVGDTAEFLIDHF